MRRQLLALLAAAGLAAGVLTGAPASAAPSAPSISSAHGWVGTWEAAPAQDATDSFTDTSIRNVVHISVGGAAVRIRLSNEFGTGPLVFGHVTVARQASGENSAVAAPGSLREATFGGHRSVTARAGGDVLSDPVPLAVPAQANLLVTVYLAQSAGPVTYHGLAWQTSFLGPNGDHAADQSGTAFTGQTSAWFYLTGVDVLNRVARGAVVAFGDSITDGYQSTYGTNRRWPDFLAGRILAQATLAEAGQQALSVQATLAEAGQPALSAQPKPAGEGQQALSDQATLADPGSSQRRSGPLGVLNAGISGNRLLLPGDPVVFGPSALVRLTEDALSRTGVRSMIVLEGINDIQQTPHQTDPTKIEAALRTIAHRAHARGVRVIGGTITPFKGWFVYDETLEATRLAVNDFIRTSRVFDAVIDFDRAVRDPADPHRLLPAYDSNDHLHPGDAGYRAMADAIDLSVL
jgi:lysophospholipase L1-like esterase